MPKTETFSTLAETTTTARSRSVGNVSGCQWTSFRSPGNFVLSSRIPRRTRRTVK
jgi:hypothetical protein